MIWENGNDGSARYYLTDQVDSVKVVLDDSGEAVTRFEYLPYGEAWFTEKTEGVEEEHSPKFNSQELDRESGFYFFNERHYDSVVARFVSADTVVDGEFDTQGWNRFSYVKGNPVVYRDPTGHEAYTVVWQSKKEETGHAGIAIDNYKLENGKKVKDGTLTYYDLWPKKSVGSTELQDEVNPDYNKRIVKNINDLIHKDPSISGKKGYVSEFGESRSPDNIVKIKSNSKQDTIMKEQAEKIIKSNDKYNASSNNCSSFVQNVLRSVSKKFNASQKVKVTGLMKMMGYKDADVVAPNNLHNEASSQPGSDIIKGEKNIEAKPYLEYFGK